MDDFVIGIATPALDRRICEAHAPMTLELKDRYQWGHPDAREIMPFFNLVAYQCPHCRHCFTAMARLEPLTPRVMIRLQRGSLDESMKTLDTVFATRAAIWQYLRERYSHLPFPDDAVLDVQPYMMRPDDRIGWSETHVVCVDGLAVAFASGPLDPVMEALGA